MRVVLPSPDSPAATRGRKRCIPSVHKDIILTNDHNCEVGAAFGDNSVPLRKRTRERRRRRTQRHRQTWLGKFAIPIPLDISANESRNSDEVRGGSKLGTEQPRAVFVSQLHPSELDSTRLDGSILKYWKRRARRAHAKHILHPLDSICVTVAAAAAECRRLAT